MLPTTITDQATSRWNRPQGPLAGRVFGQRQLVPAAQPMLPGHIAPRVIADADAIDPLARQRAAAITVIAIETLSGLRPVSQLERCFAPPLLYLMSHLRNSHRAAGIRIHSIRLQSPCPDVIEVCVHLRREKRSCAAALRLVHQRAGWVCTKFEIALQPDKIMRASIGEP